MVVIDAFSAIFNIATKISDLAHNLQANKNQCLLLSERVAIISDLVGKLKNSKVDLKTFLLYRLRAENIVKCNGVILDPGKECLIMELKQGGSLQNHLVNADNIISPKLQKQFALKIAYGINCIHQQCAYWYDKASQLGNDEAKTQLNKLLMKGV